MSEFVLELGFEEMPARFLKTLSHDFQHVLALNLDSHMISFELIRVYSTPRRLCAYISGLADSQEERVELITGPPLSIGLDENGKPTRAAQGFASSHQVKVEGLIVHSTEKGSYLAVEKNTGGRKSIEILPEICVSAVNSLSFPKKMRLSDRFAFGRPIRWILAVHDSQVVDFQVSDIRASDFTFGHRVLGPGPFKVNKASEFMMLIREKGKVILDPEERSEIIRRESEKMARQIGGQVIANDALIQENANLVEFPRPIMGGFDSKYLELPREVLLTSMETHQKSFGLTDTRGRLLPYFLAVINNDPENPELIRKGWERVLKARLEDAVFFWETDKYYSFDEWLEKMEKVVFLAPLGSMGDKSRRLERISGYLCDHLQIADKKDVQKAALICKADLVSEMVREFADLQGIMGGIYASHAGFKDSIARAVYEHYLPLGPETDPPSSPEGAIVSLADKADNLVGCFGLEMLPTGAADPYALRRQTLGIIRIILAHKLRLNLEKLLSFTAKTYVGVQWKQDPQQALEKLLHFFAVRLKSYWQARGFDNKLVEAVIQSGYLDVLSAEYRLSAINEFSSGSEFEAAVLTYKRVDNIVRKHEESSGLLLSQDYDPALLQERHEIELHEAITKTMSDWDTLWKKEDYRQLFAKLHTLRPYVDAFFDNVMVMCNEPLLRENRLSMLNFLSQRFRKLADFSALQV